MDNASKALIMAGAILISVAIVGIGIYIFSAANGMTNDAINQMESTQVSMFNSNFYRYANDKDSILGSRVKELIAYAKTQGFSTSGTTNLLVLDGVTEATINTRSRYTITYDTDKSSAYINKITIKLTSTSASVSG